MRKGRKRYNKKHSRQSRQTETYQPHGAGVCGDAGCVGRAQSAYPSESDGAGRGVAVGEQVPDAELTAFGGGAPAGKAVQLAGDRATAGGVPPTRGGGHQHRLRELELDEGLSLVHHVAVGNVRVDRCLYARRVAPKLLVKRIVEGEAHAQHGGCVVVLVDVARSPLLDLQ
jgi:hypothetical protein